MQSTLVLFLSPLMHSYFCFSNHMWIDSWEQRAILSHVVTNSNKHRPSLLYLFLCLRKINFLKDSKTSMPSLHQISRKKSLQLVSRGEWPKECSFFQMLPKPGPLLCKVWFYLQWKYQQQTYCKTTTRMLQYGFYY